MGSLNFIFSGSLATGNRKVDFVLKMFPAWSSFLISFAALLPSTQIGHGVEDSSESFAQFDSRQRCARRAKAFGGNVFIRESQKALF